MHESTLNRLLTDPFEPNEVKWKAQVVRGTRALIVAYVDARCVEDRLDQVFGVDGWQDEFTVLPNNSVVCKLRVKIGAEWIEKSDVGSQSEQPDEGDRVKSAFSDALKRAAVKFGIGRYLYRLPHQWVDYDTQTRQIKGKPTLPDWAVPKAPRNDDAGTPPANAPKNGAKPLPPKQEAYITRQQWEELKGEINARGLSQRAVLAYYQVDAPPRFPTAQLSDALKRVQSNYAGFKLQQPVTQEEEEADVETPIE